MVGTRSLMIISNSCASNLSWCLMYMVLNTERTEKVRGSCLQGLKVVEYDVILI